MREGQESKSVITELWQKKWRFIALVLLVFFVTLSLLISLGWVPEGVTGLTRSLANEQQASAAAVREQPQRVVINAIGVDATIVNPESRDIDVLDAALKDGVVRFPGSSGLTDTGNMFLFGHSSFLPVVRNENYKAFNNLDKLEQGDIIELYGGGRKYVYAVSTVRLDDAAAINVSLGGSERKLTLSTCNSFGAESERFVVEADFVGSYPLAS